MKLLSEFKILRTNILSCKNQPSIDETISDFLSEETHLKYKLIPTWYHWFKHELGLPSFLLLG
jgi:hypothetical protein